MPTEWAGGNELGCICLNQIWEPKEMEMMALYWLDAGRGHEACEMSRGSLGACGRVAGPEGQWAVPAL
jgi:hypothetical protein